MDMKLTEAKEKIQNNCNHLYEQNELENIAWRVFEHILQKDKLHIMLEKNIEIDETSFNFILEKLKRNIPIQYIVGYEYFGKLKLYVNEHVLIPRPETEELCHIISQGIRRNAMKQTRMLDIGTGSGCIPIYLKKENKELDVYAMDISKEALEVAQKNALTYNAQIHFMQADILDENISLDQTFDIIISNPPYILEHEKAEMNTRVFEHEPNIALFVSNNDALQFYHAILLFAKKHMKKHGKIYFEINKHHAQSVVQLCQQNGYEAEIKKDMYQNNRFVIVQ